MGRFLTKLFALMGMTLTCVACYGTPYTEYYPRPHTKAHGRVIDEAGRPIPNIKVKLGAEHTSTIDNGTFYIYGDDDEVILTDMDGADNLGEFEKAIFVLQRGDNNLGDIVLRRLDE